MDQLTLETLTSKRNARSILQRTIAQELDEVLLDWALQAFIKLPDWLDHPWQENQKPYASKANRIQTLKDWLPDYGMENLIIDIAYAIIHKFEDLPLQDAVRSLASNLPYDDPFEAASVAASLITILQSPDGDGFYTLKPGATYFSARENRQKRRMATIKVNNWPDLAPAFAGAYAWINDTNYSLPLIEPPRNVKDNRSCGYHSIREPLILGNQYTQHEKPLNYDAINALNSIEWTLDHFILNMTPVLPDGLDDATQESFLEGFKVAIGYLKHRPFHLAWQYDSRGRIYDHGYNIHFQSFDYAKACLNLNQAERLTT